MSEETTQVESCQEPEQVSEFEAFLGVMQDAVSSATGVLTVAEIVGVLELVKLELVTATRERALISQFDVAEAMACGGTA